MTRGEITGRVQQWFGLQSIDGYDEVPLIHDMIFRGTIDLLARTRCVVRCVHLHTSPGVDEYVLDHGVISLVDVEDGSSKRRRRDQHLAGFTLVRSDVLLIKPTPTEMGEIQVWAVVLPSKMDDDAQSPGDDAYGAIPEEFQDAVELYTLWRCADYNDDASSQVGERYRVLYEGQDGKAGRLAEIRKLVNKRGTARAPHRNTVLSASPNRRVWVG